MEEKKKEVRAYLDTAVNPILKPLVEEIAKKRPNDVIGFMIDYLNKEKARQQVKDSSDEDDQNEELLRKLEEKKKAKKHVKKVSRQGISAEAFGMFNKKEAFVARVVEKSPETESKIAQLIQKSIMFKSLSKDELKVVIQAMEEVVVDSGDPIITEGEQGNVLYVVAQGQHDCSKVINGKQTYLKTYKPGEIFGELALMYNAPRAASIKAKTKGKLFSLDRQTFNNLVQEAALNKRKNYMDILSKVEILAEMDPNEKDKLCDTLFEENYGANEFVVRQGESGDRFYIVADGRLHAQKLIEGELEPKKVFEYKAGDYFGEIALLKNTVRQASIVTDSPARIVSVQRDAFKRLLGPIENILQRNMQKYKKYCAD